MQHFGAQANPDIARGTRAGLVLLYAPAYDHFSPAYLLSERDLVIGRDPTSGICVPEGAVSRQHARIGFSGGKWVITDLGSRNGTLVDGRFVTELALEDLHEIRVGDASFKFVAAGAESYARYRIDGATAGPPDVPSFTGIVGGFQVRMLLRALHRVAKSEISVVVLGESGTGKELFARELHAASGRKGSFQAVNCAAIPGSLLESELFGYKRGAFSGAERDKMGIVQAANGGTLLLDEIGDMPLDAQTKLLRVLQSKEIIPVGATQPERVDVRVVCATHRNLSQLQKDGRFRGDLFARLNEYSVVLPPLRERKEDIYALVTHMLRKHDRPDLRLSFSFMTGLLHYDWPFNIRELEAALKRAVALGEGTVLDAPHLPDVITEVMREYGVITTEGTRRQVDDVRATSPALAGPVQVSRQYPPQIAPPAFVPPNFAVQPTAPGEIDVQPASAPPPTVMPGAYPYGAPDAPGRAPEPPRGAANPSEEELRALLAQHKGNVAAVGRVFGKERMQVHRWLKRYGIDVEQYR
ncbi:MAG: sigma 54-interacting transcriptional regulator [Myxococcales bacterium]|nr:sigma 54-interacting transcriptional regulator [Myxococcales bacterium]